MLLALQSVISGKLLVRTGADYQNMTDVDRVGGFQTGTTSIVLRFTSRLARFFVLGRHPGGVSRDYSQQEE